MKSYSTLTIGLASAAVVLLLLAVARLWMPQVRADVQLREVEVITLDEPPPPPPPPEDPPPDAPPPPPALTDVSEVPDPSRVPVPKADLPLDITLPVDPFFTEVDVSPLPPSPVAKPKSRTETRPNTPTTDRPRKPERRITGKPPTAKPTPPKPQRSNYGINELDGRPRLIRSGRGSFPRSLARQGVTRGTVVFEVELSTRGRVTVRRVISSTHSELISEARKIARGSRFTAPTRNGEKVKAVMRLPITIQK